MLVSRFVWWLPCQAVWWALFAVLFIELCATQEPCVPGSCPVADHVTRVASYRFEQSAAVR